MHVIDFFDALFFTPDVHVVPALLPHSIVGVMVHGGGQLKLLQHLLAPREDKVPAQVKGLVTAGLNRLRKNPLGLSS